MRRLAALQVARRGSRLLVISVGGSGRSPPETSDAESLRLGGGERPRRRESAVHTHGRWRSLVSAACLGQEARDLNLPSPTACGKPLQHKGFLPISPPAKHGRQVVGLGARRSGCRMARPTIWMPGRCRFAPTGVAQPEPRPLPSRDRPLSLGPYSTGRASVWLHEFGVQQAETAGLRSCRRTRSCRRHLRARARFASRRGVAIPGDPWVRCIRSASCLGSVMPCCPCCRAPPISATPTARGEPGPASAGPDPSLRFRFVGRRQLSELTARIFPTRSCGFTKLRFSSHRSTVVHVGSDEELRDLRRDHREVEIPTSMVNTPTTRPAQ